MPYIGTDLGPSLSFQRPPGVAPSPAVTRHLELLTAQGRWRQGAKGARRWHARPGFLGVTSPSGDESHNTTRFPHPVLTQEGEKLALIACPRRALHPFYQAV